MQKLIGLLLACLLLVVTTGSAVAEGAEDTVPPVIKVLEKKIIVKEGEQLELKNYIEVTDDQSDVRVVSISPEDINEAGEHEVDLYAFDKSGNVSTVKVTVNVFTEEEYEEYYSQLNYRKYSTDTLNQNMERIRGYGDGSGDAYDLALSFIGMPGYCYYVAQQFIYALFGNYSLADIYPVSAYEIEPGDIIYYANGGLGIEHWAVYLGGYNALHGNFNGTTVIGNVYLNYASEPVFYRVNR